MIGKILNKTETVEKVKNFFENSEFLYILYSEYGIKIGISNNPLNRIEQIKQGLPSKNVILIGLYSGEHTADYEKKLHKKYTKRKISGEWFIFNQENLDEIDRYLSQNNFHKIIKVSLLWANYLYPSIFLKGQIKVIETVKNLINVRSQYQNYELLDKIILNPSIDEVPQNEFEYLTTNQICKKIENIYPSVNSIQLGKYHQKRGFNKYSRRIDKFTVRKV